MAREPSVTLHWLPLGAGGRVVRLCGAAWERTLARIEGRVPRPIFHAALEVAFDSVARTIEIAPVVNSLPDQRGVVATGPVGARWAGRWAIFRYELRCWPGGRIPDLEFETTAPVILSRSEEVAERLAELAPHVPMLVWGRDESGYGDMWNSNSVIAWLLARAGIDPSRLGPPDGGRAPGWRAGLMAAGPDPPVSRRS